MIGGPPSLGAVPDPDRGGARLPGAWSTLDQTVVDVSTVIGTDHKPVDAHLCGAANDPNNTLGTLPNGSLKGKIALVSAATARSSRRPSVRDSPGRSGSS